MLRFVFGLLALLLISGRASADAWQENWQHCAGTNASLAIAGCTALIDGNQELPNDLAAAYYNRGWHYAETGDDNKAIDDFSHAIEIRPDYVDALDNRGRTYKRMGKMDLAIADFDRVLTFKPGDPDILLARKQCDCGKNRPKAALR